MGRRSRSPNYPRISLASAIERVEKVYKKESTHKISREAVAESLGYTSLNGASLGVLSTLKQYGLLEEAADGLRASQDAVALVMLPEGDSERIEALQKAAFAPRLFSELRDEYGETLPSDVSLRYALIKKGFTEKAANEVIRSYRDTLELVSEESGEYTEGADDTRPEVETPMQPTREARQGAVSYGGGFAESFAGTAASPTKVLQFQLLGNSTARIELMGDVTQEALDMLVAILNAQKLAFPNANELKRAVEQPAEQTAIEPPSSE